jgi:hypothetical protein
MACTSWQEVGVFVCVDGLAWLIVDAPFAWLIGDTFVARRGRREEGIEEEEVKEGSREAAYLQPFGLEEGGCCHR